MTTLLYASILLENWRQLAPARSATLLNADPISGGIVSPIQFEESGAVAKPTILTVDDDPVVSQAITRDLRKQYGSDYQIVRALSGGDALKVLTEFALREKPVALIVSDQRMPGMTGVEFLEQTRDQAPGAKLVLLTAYADTDVAIRAINDIDLDYYLLKPWDPPEERLYPVLDGLLSDWRDAYVDDSSGLRVVGDRWSERSHDIKTFLARNHVPYQWFDLERDDEAKRLHDLAEATAADLPLVLIPEGETLRAPSNLALANALGLRTSAQQPLYDLCIVGGGPAGLAAAVYGASEGLQTVVIEREAPGGQAGQSASIENYLGFPKGLSGADLTHRAVAQARRFGAEMVLARDVVGFEVREPARAVRIDDGVEIEAKAVVVATGVSYRMVDAPGLRELTGRGVYYGTTPSEVRMCAGEDVYIVGAANSAGQAALNLSQYARRVVMLVRSDSLEKSMSHYLVERINASDRIEVRLRSEIVAGHGDDHLQAITIADGATGSETEVSVNWLFVYIGATPRTDWLGKEVARDDSGAIITGQDLLRRDDDPQWPLKGRAPFALETSVPGVFAAGDVRVDSMKRVASAVGEGAMSVYLVHRYLATI
jgi:thioredoxin reductase (NADPH)